jgi:phosphopantetheinyl transferase
MQTILIKSASDKAALHDAGLLAARRAVAIEFGMPFPERMAIRKNALGKPSARLDDRAISISISHAAPYAFAACEKRQLSIGVDIEQVRTFRPEVYQAFCSTNELCLIESWRDDERNFRQTLAWSLKEATLKALGVGLRTSPALIDVSDALFAGGDRTIAINNIEYRAEVWWTTLEGGSFVAASVVLLGVPVLVSLNENFPMLSKY